MTRPEEPDGHLDTENLPLQRRLRLAAQGLARPATDAPLRPPANAHRRVARPATGLSLRPPHGRAQAQLVAPDVAGGRLSRHPVVQRHPHRERHTPPSPAEPDATPAPHPDHRADRRTTGRRALPQRPERRLPPEHPPSRCLAHVEARPLAGRGLPQQPVQQKDLRLHHVHGHTDPYRLASHPASRTVCQSGISVLKRRNLYESIHQHAYNRETTHSHRHPQMHRTFETLVLTKFLEKPITKTGARKAK